MTTCAISRPAVAAPGLPAAVVRRDRLRSLLDATVRSAAVTLVRGRPGQGRTVMLADWAATEPTAWVSVRTAIRRPDRFWGAVAAAVARVAPHPATDLQRLARTADPITAGDVLPVLDRLPDEVRLVLDDVHELPDPALGELRTLIRYRPSPLRLVLSSRAEPPLPLARLRLQGDLADVPGDVLVFTPEETAAFVAAAGLPARADEIEHLHRLTGGWATALRLAVDAARRTTGLDGVLPMLAGADGPGAGRLARGMLGRLRDTDRVFLGAISVADPVPTALALELADLDDAPAVLARLRDLGLVTEGPEAGLLRTQPLLRRHLRADLARRHPTRAATLHDRAARWFAGTGHPVRALEHARQTDDDGLVADLVRAWAVPLVLTGHHEDLRAAFRRLGSDTVARDRRLRAAADVLDAAGTARGGGGDPDGEVASLHALRDRVRAAAPPGERVGGTGTDRAGIAAVAATYVLGDGADLLLRRDEPAAARRALRDAQATAREWGWSYLVMRCASLLAAADLVDSDTAGMAEHAAVAIEAAADGGCSDAVPAVSSRVVLAYAALLQARPAEARTHAAAGMAAAGATCPACLRLQLHALHGAAQADDGRPAEGLEEIRQARTTFADGSLAAREATLVATLEHEIAVASGRPEHARAVRRWITGRVGTTGDVLLMTARADSASLHPLLDGSAPALLVESEIEARLREIGAGQVVTDPAGARTALRGALDRAEPLGLVRPFAHSPGSVRRLMAHQVGSFGDTDAFVRRALAAGPPGRRAGPVDALSERETAVLRLLPSLATMSEIARELEVSVNTVKTQVGAVYAKLGVGDRRGAVVAAYDAGLLPTDPEQSGVG